MSNQIKTLPGSRVLASAGANQDWTSHPTDIRFLDNVSYQTNVSGSDTPDLTLGFETSLDYKQDPQGNVVNAGHWVPIQDPPGTNVALDIDSAGSYMAKLNQLSEPYVRATLVTGFAGTGVQTIVAVADVSKSLAGTYFMLYAQDGTVYYVWFKVSGTGSDPAVAGATGLEADISTNDTAGAVATAIDAAVTLGASADFTSSINMKTPTLVTLTNQTTGKFQRAADASAPKATGFTFTVTTPNNVSDVWVAAKAI